MAAVAPTRQLTLAAARRVAVAAQGLGKRRERDAAPATRSQVLKTTGAQGLLQIDSVNVLARAHYMPLFSRLGTYDNALLDDAVWPTGRRPRRMIEAWAHEASIIPIELYPLLWWRRRDLAAGRWGGRDLRKRNPGLVEAVLGLIGDEGPMSAGQIEKTLSGAAGRGGSWWGWTDTKVACEVLFAAGETSTAYRRGFERFYDLTDRVVPAEFRPATPMDEDEAKRRLVEIAARRLGIGTRADIADWWRMKGVDAAVHIGALVAEGVLEPVTVDGWRDIAYLHSDVTIPRRVDGAALLCPFDPLIWSRPRTERLFDFHYRIEIYTPAVKRVHGYYVFPMLLGDRLVGRFDLKADRQNGELLVQAAWLEPGHSAAEVDAPAVVELQRMASWLGLDRVRVKPRGDLALSLV